MLYRCMGEERCPIVGFSISTCDGKLKIKNCHPLCMVMHYLEELEIGYHEHSNREIARALGGVSHVTINTIIRKAQYRLKKEMSKNNYDYFFEDYQKEI